MTGHPLSTPAARIKWARKKLGWSRQQLADAIDQSLHAITRIENGATLPLETAARICQAIRFDIAWLAWGMPDANYEYIAFASDLTQSVIELSRKYNMPPNFRERDAYWTAQKKQQFAAPSYSNTQLESAAAAQLEKRATTAESE